MIQSLSKNLSVVVLFLLILGFCFTPKAHAALTNLSDTISTSRPSAASPLSAEISANATQAQIYDNSTIFLSSDSAKIYPTAGESLDTGKNVSSMSASGVPSVGNRTVYLSGSCAGAGCFAYAHHVGMDVLVDNVTAVHTISFNSTLGIASGQTISITFPGSGSNIASPSATTFSFNGLTASQVTFGGTAASPCATAYITVSAPTITCTANGSISAGTITVTIGSVPILINPTKTASSGTADLWKLQIQTPNDTAKVTIGTVESVQVQATVDPTLTFTIAAVSGAINTGNTTGCTNSESVNSGIASTATTVNLGLLNTANINISAQLITVSTNAANGYTLTATSSGHLIDNASGALIPDTTTPTAMTADTPRFGIHACGLNVGSSWYTSTMADTTGGGTGAKYAWPTIASSITLASSATGPIGNTAGTGGVGSGLTSVEYAGSVDVTVPAGTYVSAITYTATPTF